MEAFPSTINEREHIILLWSCHTHERDHFIIHNYHEKSRKNRARVLHPARCQPPPKRTKSAIMRRDGEMIISSHCVSARSACSLLGIQQGDEKRLHHHQQRLYVLCDDKSAEVTLNSHCAPPRIKKQQRRCSWREHTKDSLGPTKTKKAKRGRAYI